MRTAFLTIAIVSLALTVTAAGASTQRKNGRILLTETYPYSGGYGALYAINPDGSGRVLITDRGVNGSWSPDGTKILFESSLKGDADLWSVDADGSSPTELTFSRGTDENPAW
jgi:hypothetical protein